CRSSMVGRSRGSYERRRKLRLSPSLLFLPTRCPRTASEHSRRGAMISLRNRLTFRDSLIGSKFFWAKVEDMNEPSTILVVDDNEDNRYLLSHRLQRLGFETVLTAVDGVHAMTMLSETPVDLVLLDVMMPRMNGHEVLQQLKARPALREIRVIMISAVDDVD